MFQPYLLEFTSSQSKNALKSSQRSYTSFLKSVSHKVKQSLLLTSKKTLSRPLKPPSSIVSKTSSRFRSLVQRPNNTIPLMILQMAVTRRRSREKARQNQWPKKAHLQARLHPRMSSLLQRVSKRPRNDNNQAPQTPQQRRLQRKHQRRE